MKRKCFCFSDITVLLWFAWKPVFTCIYIWYKIEWKWSLLLLCLLIHLYFSTLPVLYIRIEYQQTTPWNNKMTFVNIIQRFLQWHSMKPGRAFSRMRFSEMMYEEIKSSFIHVISFIRRSLLETSQAMHPSTSNILW